MMKILAINPISFKKRMIEFLFDYLFILAYLGLLFLSSMPIYGNARLLRRSFGQRNQKAHDNGQ